VKRSSSARRAALVSRSSGVLVLLFLGLSGCATADGVAPDLSTQAYCAGHVPMPEMSADFFPAIPAQDFDEFFNWLETYHDMMEDSGCPLFVQD